MLKCAHENITSPSSIARHRVRVTAFCLLAAFAGNAHAAETVTVIEYYKQNLDAYFITARSNEQVLVTFRAPGRASLPMPLWMQRLRRHACRLHLGRVRGLALLWCGN